VRLKGWEQATYYERNDVYTFPRPVKLTASAEAAKEIIPARNDDNQR